MGCGNKLVTPAMASGQTLSGYMVHKVFGTKAMYLKPQVELIAAKVNVICDYIVFKFLYQTIQLKDILHLPRNSWVFKHITNFWTVLNCQISKSYQVYLNHFNIGLI